MTVNGTTKTVSIILVTAIALGSIIWGFATQSGNLNRVVEDVAEVEAVCIETAKGLTDVEKAIILIQSDFSHTKDDIAGILALLQRQALNIPEYTED